MKILDIITESHHKCPQCGGPLVSESELMEKKDACYYKIKSSAKVWPSAYASGRLVQCRKKGAANYGNKSESVAEGSLNEFAPYDHNKGDDDNNGGRKKIEKMFYEVKIGEEFQLVKHHETFGVKIDDHTAHFYEEDMGEVGEDYGIERVSWDEPVRADWYFMEGENWSKHNNKRAGGMSKKSVASYRRSHPGSKIQTAVTTKPSKLKKGSKAAKRRASFCARMRGMKKHRTSAKTAHDPNSNINKSLRRWHCESVEELHELVMLAEQFIRNNKK